MRIGLLNGGGDCPGLNAVTRAVVRRGEGVLGHKIVGFRHGWRGVIDGEVVELTVESTRGLLYRGGTVLGTSRTNPYKQEGAIDKVRGTLQRERIEVLIAVGGEDTLGVAHRLCSDGVVCVGVPKTIDNDLSATDYTFGFDTAVQIATEAIDRLQTTAESHDRVLIVEVMGRHAGWIALHSGLGGGADAILIPEVPFDLNELVAQLEHRHARGVNSSIVVVAEGATPREGTMATLDHELDEFGHVRLGGIAARIAPELQERTGFDTRVVVLGHLLRGGTPTAYDRILATRFGLAAVDAAHDRESDVMVALRGTEIVRVPLGDAVGSLKTVPPERFAEAEVFFGVSEPLATSDALSDLLVLLELEPLEVNLFRGVSPEENQQRVFGGQVAAQALVAAGRTVEPDRPVHSLHAYFLRPGDPNVPIIYEVDRIRDGRSFTTRRVVAIQHGRAIFNLAASFQVVERGPDHAAPMPSVPDPDRLPTFRERLEPYLDRFGTEMIDWLTRERPIDSRPVDDPKWLAPGPRAPSQDVWIRANGALPDDPLVHACVVAYASDLSLLDTATLPHAIGYTTGNYQMASLDHAMWFHRPFRADDWLLYSQTSPSASGARGLAVGHVFTRGGTLAVTVIQEGLMRPVDAPPAPESDAA